jgi:hypothetical protein
MRDAFIADMVAIMAAITDGGTVATTVVTGTTVVIGATAVIGAIRVLTGPTTGAGDMAATTDGTTNTKHPTTAMVDHTYAGV